MFRDYFVRWKLKELRQEAGLTQQKVADHLRWPVARYQYLENGYVKPFLYFWVIDALLELFPKHGIDPDRIRALDVDHALAAGYVYEDGDRVRYRLPWPSSST